MSFVSASAEESTDSMALSVWWQVLRVRRITETSKQCAPQIILELPCTTSGRNATPKLYQALSPVGQWPRKRTAWEKRNCEVVLPQESQGRSGSPPIAGNGGSGRSQAAATLEDGRTSYPSRFK